MAYRQLHALVAGILLPLSMSCGGRPPERLHSSSPALSPADTVQLTGASIGRRTFAIGNTPRGGQGQPVSGISCTMDTVGYHIHAHVSLFVNGTQVMVPAGIGLVEPRDTLGMFYPTRCPYWLHTHDGTGILHIEAPAVAQFTLGQFFDVWGQPLSSTNIAGFTGPVTVFVNGERYTGDPRAIILAPQQQITLQVGTPVITPVVYIHPDGRRAP